MQSVGIMRITVDMCIMFILTLWLTPLLSETQVDNGPFIDSECIACHYRTESGTDQTVAIRASCNNP